ncbi:MAG: GNAT family N-acetyltransferase [Clostridia bacterium]|nr:GNAT family N-acetyltransferase [Clostridia bacterium]
MIKIREANINDAERVEYICKMTADEKSKTEEKAGKITSTIYASYYIEEEPDNAFVLEDDGVVVGYIVCAENYRSFKTVFTSVYSEKVKNLSKSAGLFARVLPFPYVIFGRKYPAHLHINLLPGYRSNGYGAEMIKLLEQKLRGKGVKGVMLMASKENTGAVRFYKRNGFEIIISAFGGVVMAKSLR